MSSYRFWVHVFSRRITSYYGHNFTAVLFQNGFIFFTFWNVLTDTVTSSSERTQPKRWMDTDYFTIITTVIITYTIIMIVQYSVTTRFMPLLFAGIYVLYANEFRPELAVECQ